MSDKGFVDLGDELIVRIAGYPVGRAQVTFVGNDGIVATVTDSDGKPLVQFVLPLDIMDYENIDGVAHETPECGQTFKGNTCRQPINHRTAHHNGTFGVGYTAKWENTDIDECPYDCSYCRDDE